MYAADDRGPDRRMIPALSLAARRSTGVIHIYIYIYIYIYVYYIYTYAHRPKEHTEVYDTITMFGIWDRNTDVLLRPLH